jgi:hypothetical protein
MGLGKTLALDKPVDVKLIQTKNRIPYVHAMHASKNLQTLKNIARLYSCVFNMQNKIEPTIMKRVDGSNRI